MTNEKLEFLSVCDELKTEILEDLAKVHKLSEEARSWIDEMIEYNCKGGKLNRGLSVPHNLKILREKSGCEFTEVDKKNSYILGMCIEWLQAFFLVADDVMDASITRRGKPCWFRLPKVQNIAINDSFLLESFIYQILKKHFRNESYYLNLVELFKEVTYQTELGQLMDLTSQPLDKPVDLNLFTPERYRNIVVFKTAYYTFFLPVAAAMYLSGIKDDDLFEGAKGICEQIGEYFQVQDDFLDCYGNPAMIGKVGTDIQETKCSWLVVQALLKVTEPQRSILIEHYGKQDDASVQAVKDLYKDLKLEAEYENFEEDIYRQICGSIQNVRGIPEEVFKVFVDQIYKREK